MFPEMKFPHLRVISSLTKPIMLHSVHWIEHLQVFMRLALSPSTQPWETMINVFSKERKNAPTIYYVCRNTGKTCLKLIANNGKMKRNDKKKSLQKTEEIGPVITKVVGLAPTIRSFGHQKS